jgi:SAM-dependent methyltransferase
MTDAHVLAFVRSSLPPAPARVLEVGAGEGELAEALRTAGYDVLAIDPGSSAAGVVPVALLDVAEPPGSFDAAVAVVSLHHVAPLAESCAHLAELIRPGGALVVDEFDIARFEGAAAEWWSDRHEKHPHPGETASALRGHLHPIPTIREHLGGRFALSPISRGPYLYRFQLSERMRAEEERAIAEGRMPATGARFIGTRRS